MEYSGAQVTRAAGLAASTLGYACMVTAAVLLPAWRRDHLRRVWLHACAVALLHAALDFFWDCTQDRMPPAPRLYLLKVIVFLMQVSACWSLAAAWLAHRRLARVFEPPPERCTLKCCALAWGPPLASQAALQAYRAAVAAPARGALAALYLAPVAAACCGGVALYAHALVSAGRGGARHGRTSAPHVARLAALALVFLLMSGAHSSVFLVMLLFNGELGLDADALGDLFNCIISFRVFVFSFILVFGMKSARNMWMDAYKKHKRLKCNVTPSAEANKETCSVYTKEFCCDV